MRSNADYARYLADTVGECSVNAYTRMTEFIRSGEKYGIVTLRTNISPFYSDCPVSEIVIGVGSGPWPPALLTRTNGCNGVGILRVLSDDYLQFGSKEIPMDVHMARASEAYETMKHLGAKVVGDTHSEAYLKRPRDDNRRITPMGKNDEKNQVVSTPPEFYETINALFHFDHDPCPVNPTKDAMKSTWGKCNFVNPPFKHIPGFIARAIHQSQTEGVKSVMLVPGNTLTSVAGFRLIRNPHITGVIFLRNGLLFEGYDRPMPLAMMLVLVTAHTRKNDEIQMAFWDPFIGKSSPRRNVKTIHSADIPRWLDSHGWNN